MTAQAERPLHELLSHDMVDIYVGPYNKHWVLHEKLLCHRSRFFRSVFRSPSKSNKSTPTKPTTNSNKPSATNSKKLYGLPDDSEAAFDLFVAWLYSSHLPAPDSEEDLSPLLDLYLMAEKWEIKNLILESLDAVRRFYHQSDTWPSLRRVQYVYGNTPAGSAPLVPDDSPGSSLRVGSPSPSPSPLRMWMVECVGRMLVTGEGDGAPKHWEMALRRDGQLALDVLLCVRKWKLDPGSVPDIRAESVRPVVEDAEEKGMGMMGGEEVDDDEEEDVDNTLDWGEAKTWSGDTSRSESQQVNGASEKDHQ